jgi:hypothetical protein
MTHGVTSSAYSNVECLMSTAVSQPVVLTAHPSTPCESVRSLTVSFSVRDGEVLALEYALDADLSRLRIPARRGERRADELWRHTCFEAFIVTDDSPGYYELNFSPSWEWAAYRFSAYRTGMAPADGVGVPEIALQPGTDSLRLQANIAIAAIREVAREAQASQSGAVLRVALAAVIEEDSGTLSYWAQKHPPGKPDFHHSDGFAAEIPP